MSVIAILQALGEQERRRIDRERALQEALQAQERAGSAGAEEVLAIVEGRGDDDGDA